MGHSRPESSSRHTRRRFLKTALAGSCATLSGSRCVAVNEPGLQVWRDYVQDLGGGRRYGIRIFGAEPDRVEHDVFYFHGMPVSRLDGWFLDAAAAQKRVRLIAVDRPGMGLSTRQRNRTLCDISGDIRELAQALQIPRYSIIGHSYGTASACACGLTIDRDELWKVALVGPFAPPASSCVCGPAQRQAHFAATVPLYGHLMFRLARAGVKSPLPIARKLVLKVVFDTLPSVDQEFISQSRDMKHWLLSTIGQCLRQGTAAALREINLGVRPWPFRLDQIPNGDRFTIWHGDADTFTPFQIANYLHAGNGHDFGIQGSRLEIATGQGHYTILCSHASEIVNSVLRG